MTQNIEQDIISFLEKSLTYISQNYLTWEAIHTFSKLKMAEFDNTFGTIDNKNYSKNIIEAIAVLTTLSYAGWTADQLQDLATRTLNKYF